MAETITADHVVDARGAACPGPLMDLIGQVKKAESGDVIELQTEDEGSKNDVPEWIEESGNELLEIVDTGEYYSIFVKKT